jgi:hypothetical protein
MKSPIHISIAFGDAILPVIDCEDGHQRVPLKPISDQIGLNWTSQRTKVTQNNYLNQRLGVNLVPVKGYQDGQKEGRKPQICIRIDRVTTFLNSLNPENIRGMGNHDAADWLEAKHSEWDDALHHYETDGFAIKESQDARQLINTLSQIDRIKDPTIKRIAAQKANAAFAIEIPIGNQKAMDV